MKNFKFMLTLLGLMACSDEQQNAVFVDVTIDISIQSNDGTDLLDPVNQNSFDENQIRVYHLIDDTLKEVNEPNLDHPRGFFVFDGDPDLYRIRIFGNTINDVDLITTYVKWNESVTDTLKYSIDRRNNGSFVSINRVWFNGLDVYDEHIDNERYFVIIK